MEKGLFPSHVSSYENALRSTTVALGGGKVRRSRNKRDAIKLQSTGAGAGAGASINHLNKNKKKSSGVLLLSGDDDGGDDNDDNGGIDNADGNGDDINNDVDNEEDLGDEALVGGEPKFAPCWYHSVSMAKYLFPQYRHIKRATKEGYGAGLYKEAVKVHCDGYKAVGFKAPARFKCN